MVTSFWFVVFMDIDVLYRLVCEQIRRARGYTGMSQAKLAKELGMSRTSVVNIEAGRQHPPLHVLWLIAEKLGTEAALLIPKQFEYREQSIPVSLDTHTVAEIERAANGDPVTRRHLTDFIGRVKAVSKQER
jgi:transcriptional regulator with XRE-family HTH domain